MLSSPSAASVPQSMVELSGPLTPRTTDVKNAIQDGYQLTEKDIGQLATPDSEFQLQTWDYLKELIGRNQIEDLKRVPSDLKRYIAWSHETKKQYGSIQAFVLKERLGWENLEPKDPELFRNPADTKILVNDWPYGNAPGILHLVVWTKCKIPTQPPVGDLTPESRAIIKAYIKKTFEDRVGEDNVQWFKNWASLQSVRSVEHVHVLVRRVPEVVLAEWVGTEAARAAYQKYRLAEEA